MAGSGIARQAWSQKGEKSMTYRWKLPGLIPVDAQTAGDELTRIYQNHGTINPKIVVAESTTPDSPLHSCFEWDNEVAGGLYREHQARTIIQSIVVSVETQESTITTRAFVYVQSEYEPLSVVICSPEKTDRLLQNALAELMVFQSKYAALKELAPVMLAIDGIRKAV